MTYFADLVPCTYFGALGDRLLAVGWLESDHEYPRGEVEPAFLARLHALLARPWQPGYFMGPHFCTLCPQARGGGRHGGVRNLFVPGNGVVYATPELIEHYVKDHGYSPPRAFIDAVLVCPEMSSERYDEAIRQNGPETYVPSNATMFAPPPKKRPS